MLWATLKLIDLDKIPAQTTVVRFALRDQTHGRLLADLRRPQPELCTRPSGYAEDIVCRTDLTTLIDLHLKRLSYRTAIRQGRIDLIGPPWLTTSSRAGSAPARSPISSPPNQCRGC